MSGMCLLLPPRAGLLMALTIVSLSTGCSATLSAHDRALESAETARRDQNFEEERVQFTRAISEAETAAERVEAQYRRAHSWAREGNLQQAALELERLARERPKSGRAARAWLDAARVRERLGEQERALSNYEKVIKRYPSSGGAEAASIRFVALSVEKGSIANRADGFRLLLNTNEDLELEEALRFLYAQALEAVSIVKAAVAYETVARLHPLPQGRHTDEALLRAAELRLAAKDYRGAVQLLELLSQHGSDAAFVGSYRRPAYAEALLLMGLILDNNLNDSKRAREVWTELTQRFPNSRLVDDAFWYLLLSIKRSGKNPCASLRALKEARPGSRYVVCEPLLCGGPLPDKLHIQKCHSYFEEAREY